MGANMDVLFTYVKTTKTLLSKFKKWIEDYDLLIIDKNYDIQNS